MRLARLAVPLLTLAALAASGCSRDLAVPDSAPPHIDAVALVGLEPQAVSTGLPVLGGELVAIRGGGFPASPADVEVRIGSEDAVVLETRPDRIVARVPALARFGDVDLQVRTVSGFRTQSGAFRYDGDGQPSGAATSDLDTSVALAFVTPVFPPGAYGFSDLAAVTGSSDSALLVVPSLGIGVGTVPLGIVPTTAASWIDLVGTTARLNVLAVSRGGGAGPLGAALGTVLLDGSSLQARAEATPLAWSLGNPSPCAMPLVATTYLGAPVVSWSEGALANQFRLAAIDPAAARAGVLAPIDAASIHPLPAGVVGFGPRGTSSIVFAAGNELYTYDTAAPHAPPKVLQVAPGGIGPPQSVSGLLTPGKGCPAAIDGFYALAIATTGTSEALAVSYRAAGADWVALVDLGPGPTTGTVRSGVTLARTSLALAPDPAYATSVAWQVLGTGGAELLRFRPAAGAPACGDLVPDAALQLSDTPAYIGMGGLAPVADGTRVLAITPDGDLVTVLPPSLTSTGPVLRIASYGGVSVQALTMGGASLPVAIAEHAATDSAASDIDTGSALLVVSLAGDRGSIGLGGGGYGRGAVWLEGKAGGGLAYTGDLRSAGTDAFARGGAAAVTPIVAGSCPGEAVRFGGARTVAKGPDLIVQGPARSGALGPDGIARFGPATPPVYMVKDTSLNVYVPDQTRLECLAGADGVAPVWDPTATGSCAPDATIPLGVQPLDVTMSAGDRVAALRVIDACMIPLGACRPGDEVCQRAKCPPAQRLVLVPSDPAAASVVVPLPASPAAVAADRGGGFLVTMRCEPGAGACFSADALCDGYGTVPGEENGALVHVLEDGSGVECLAVQPGLAGPVAVTPNGAEAWVTGTTSAAQHLVRLGLARRTSDGALDASQAAVLVSSERLYTASPGSGAPPPGGVAFTPDGATGIVTVPGQFRIQLRE
jgi:hypothetical protein